MSSSENPSQRSLIERRELEREDEESGGEGGIRTPGRGFGPYNGLANRRIQPLCHLSAGGSALMNEPNGRSIALNGLG
jgi:hypothetical protein